MKKIFTFLLLATISGIVTAQITVSHSASSVIQTSNTISCLANDGSSLTNVYSRSFKLSQDFNISNEFKIDSIQFGIEQISSDLPNGYPILIKYSISNGAYPTGTSTLLKLDTVYIKDTALALLTFPAAVLVPAASELVVEIGFLRDDATPTIFYIASNSDGETAPTYILANDCSVSIPTPTADVNFPETQLILNLFGRECISSSSNIDISACNSYTSPSGKFVWTQSGNYVDVIENVTGCDSTININLTITKINPELIHVDNYIVSAENEGTYTWINCNTQQPVANASKQILIAKEIGDYSLAISKNGCEYESSCITINTVPTEISNLTNTVLVYPNPAADFITISLDQIDSNLKYVLSDITGEQILTGQINEKQTTIPITSIKSGLYLLKICNDSGCNTYSIIKK
jgi:hypothetical protein